MKRAVVVLLLLIANAIVSSNRATVSKADPLVKSHHSLGLFTVGDQAKEHRRSGRIARAPHA